MTVTEFARLGGKARMQQLSKAERKALARKAGQGNRKKKAKK